MSKGILTTGLCLCGLAFAIEVISAPKASKTGSSVSIPSEWSRFRGPNGTGVSDLKGVPTTWKQSDYEWTVNLTGLGHSSPVIWGDKLFVCSSDGPKRILFCLDAITGQEIWQRDTVLGNNHLHQKSSHASGTPAVDAERVFVSFADEEHYYVICYDHAGQEIWKKDLGGYESQHGHGGSPVIVGDKLIVTKEIVLDKKLTEGGFVAALDCKTGEIVWQVPRASKDESYSTPMVYTLKGHDAILSLSGHTGLMALDPATGKTLWESDPFPLRTVGSPIAADGLIFAGCGQGGRGQHFSAIDPASGKVKYVRKKMVPYVPTPLEYKGRLFLWNDDGTVCCVNPKTGDDIWTERIGGNYSASPILIDGKIYAISEEGEITVIAAADKLHIYGKSPLGDNSHATPAVANGRVYFRGFHTLASLKAK